MISCIVECKIESQSQKLNIENQYPKSIHKSSLGDHQCPNIVESLANNHNDIQDTIQEQGSKQRNIIKTPSISMLFVH